LTIRFDLQIGKAYNDVLTALALTSTNQDDWLRIGLQVQGFESGGSEQYVNNPVPLPAAAWLFGSALLGMAGIGYRRHRRPDVASV
jgi:hypothetical protein